jgi:hypothetical protein
MKGKHWDLKRKTIKIIFHSTERNLIQTRQGLKLYQ